MAHDGIWYLRSVDVDRPAVTAAVDALAARSGNRVRVTVKESKRGLDVTLQVDEADLEAVFTTLDPAHSDRAALVERRSKWTTMVSFYDGEPGTSERAQMALMTADGDNEPAFHLVAMFARVLAKALDAVAEDDIN